MYLLHPPPSYAALYYVVLWVFDHFYVLAVARDRPNVLGRHGIPL